MTDDVPQHDTVTMPLHIDRKRRKNSNKRKTPSAMPRTITKIVGWNNSYENSPTQEAERSYMEKEWEIYRDTGVLGSYRPERGILRRTEDGNVESSFRDAATLADTDCVTRKREMLIGSRRFCITSVFPAEPSATATDKLLAYIDTELKKEAHSA